MKIWTNPDGKKIAVADKNKMLKIDGKYFRFFEVEDEDFLPEEVYYRSGIELPNTEGRKIEISDRLSEIRKWFQSTDWIPNKLILHEWQEDDIRAIEYRETRLAMRMEQDALIEELNNLR